MALICISVPRSLPHAMQKNTKVHRPERAGQSAATRNRLERGWRRRGQGSNLKGKTPDYSLEKTATSAPGRLPLFVRNTSLTRRSLVGRRLSFHFKFNRMVRGGWFDVECRRQRSALEVASSLVLLIKKRAHCLKLPQIINGLFLHIFNCKQIIRLI